MAAGRVLLHPSSHHLVCFLAGVQGQLLLGFWLAGCFSETFVFPAMKIVRSGYTALIFKMVNVQILKYSDLLLTTKPSLHDIICTIDVVIGI